LQLFKNIPRTTAVSR